MINFGHRCAWYSKKNTQIGYSALLGKHYCYIAPDRRKYPFQWFWDTFFHVYILCALKEYDLAKRNLESLFALQEADGFVGHMIYWQSAVPRSIWQILQARPTLKQLRPHMSVLIQPTLAAQALERIYTETQDHYYLERMLPKVKAYHEWLAANRSDGSSGLVFIISPFESGIDEKPSYDPLVGSHPHKGTFEQYLKLMRIDARNFLQRYDLPRIYRAGNFIIKDTAMNVIYALDCAALARLAGHVGADADSRSFALRAERVSSAILNLMYSHDDAAFYDLAGGANTQLKTLTFSIFFPITLPDIPIDIAKAVVKRHLLNTREFNLPYPVPSVAQTVDVFNPAEARSPFFDFLWRGPTWVAINWFLFRCLKARGFEQAAKTLAGKTRKLIEESGFREYYNPLTGEGYGTHHFTWSGLILDMIQEA